MGDQVVLKGITGSVCIGTNYHSSSITADTAYLDIPEKIWALLGIKKSLKRNCEIERSWSVSCCGIEGASTGPLTQSPVLGLMFYEGTTLEGMSGAAYYIGNTCYGMHLGSTTGVNCGVTAEVFFEEVPEMVVFEESPTGGKKAGAIKTKHTKTWTKADLNLKKNDSLQQRGRTIRHELEGEVAANVAEPAPIAFDQHAFMHAIKNYTNEERNQLIDLVKAANTMDSMRMETVLVRNQVLGATDVTLHSMHAMEKSAPTNMRSGGNLGDVVRDLLGRMIITERKNKECEESVRVLKDSISKFGTAAEIKQLSDRIQKLTEDLLSTKEKLAESEAILKDNLQEVAADTCYGTPNRAGDWQCEVCHLHFKTQEALVVHREKVHRYDQWSTFRTGGACEIAKHAFAPQTPAISSKPTTRTKRCGECDRMFETDEAIDQHRQTVHRGADLTERLPHGCGGCNRKFATQTALAQHSISHQVEIKPETAFSSDVREPKIKTDGFLEQRRVRHQKKRRNSPDTSNALGLRNQFQSLAEAQLETNELLRSLVKNWKN